MISEEMLNRWQRNAIAGNAALLDNLLEFKDEFEGEVVRHGDKMQLYEEASAANCLSDSRFRQLYYLVLRYTEKGDNDIAYWLTKGLGWEHLDEAPSLADQTGRTAKELLDEAIEIGGKNGRVMSVKEMRNFALGETQKKKVKNGYHIEKFVNVLVKNCIKFLGWTDEKVTGFENDIRAVFAKWEAA